MVDDLLMWIIGGILIRVLAKSLPFRFAFSATIVIILVAVLLSALLPTFTADGESLGWTWMLLVIFSPVIALVLTAAFSALRTAEESTELQFLHFAAVCAIACLIVLVGLFVVTHQNPY